MTTDLDTRLRKAFAAEAALAPTSGRTPMSNGVDDGTETSALHVVVGSSHGPTRRRVGLIAAGTMAAATVVVLGVIALRPIEPVDQPSQTSTFVPSGVEVPFTPAPVSAEPYEASYVIKPGSLISMTVDGRTFDQFITATDNGGQVRQMECQFERNSGGACTPFAGPIPQTVAITSSVANKTDDHDFWMWTGVPADVAFVEYHEGDNVYWQRPIAGVASFPIASDITEPYAIGLDVAGTEVTRISQSAPSAVTALIDPELLARWNTLSQQDKDQAWKIIDDLLRPCVESGELWEQCVAVADTGYQAWWTPRVTTPPATTEVSA